jgi:hypothetical protein
LTYYTKGGITFDEAYFSMPIYLRNFYYRTLVERMQHEAEAMKNVSHKPEDRPPPWVMEKYYAKKTTSKGRPNI